MTIVEVLELIENSQIGTGIRESNYYWMLNGTHVLALSLSVGAIFWFDLRAMGLNMRNIAASNTMVVRLRMTRGDSGYMSGVAISVTNTLADMGRSSARDRTCGFCTRLCEWRNMITIRNTSANSIKCTTMRWY